jgi:signal transduction histidine kinase
VTARPRARWLLLDAISAAGCALLIAGALFAGSGGDGLVTAPAATGWLAGLLAGWLGIPVFTRRLRPLGSFLAVLAGCAAVLAIGGQVIRGPFVPLALTLYLLPAITRGVLALAGLAAALALLAAQGWLLHTSGTGSGDAVVVGLVLIISWLIGYGVQQRRVYRARLRERIAEAAVTGERLRIARELHDVVAHSMTVVAVQAGFGEYVFDQQPAEARATLAAIQTVSREALADMQRLLGVLRQSGPEPGPVLAPAPGLADLDRLVSGTGGAGVKVEVCHSGQARHLPASIDQAAFRIVQEALTNVVKHSGATTATVTIGFSPAGLQLKVRDPGGRIPAVTGGRQAGHGIAGMRERVSLCGGEFTAGPRPGQGFEVIAHFPLPAPPRQGPVPAREPAIGVRAQPGQAR